MADANNLNVLVADLIAEAGEIFMRDSQHPMADFMLLATANLAMALRGLDEGAADLYLDYLRRGPPMTQTAREAVARLQQAWLVKVREHRVASQDAPEEATQ